MRGALNIKPLSPMYFVDSEKEKTHVKLELYP
jgi:hypothetical protein